MARSEIDTGSGKSNTFTQIIPVDRGSFAAWLNKKMHESRSSKLTYADVAKKIGIPETAEPALIQEKMRTILGNGSFCTDVIDYIDANEKTLKKERQKREKALQKQMKKEATKADDSVEINALPTPTVSNNEIIPAETEAINLPATNSVEPEVHNYNTVAEEPAQPEITEEMCRAMLETLRNKAQTCTEEGAFMKADLNMALVNAGKLVERARKVQQLFIALQNDIQQLMEDANKLQSDMLKNEAEAQNIATEITYWEEQLKALQKVKVTVDPELAREEISYITESEIDREQLDSMILKIMHKEIPDMDDEFYEYAKVAPYPVFMNLALIILLNRDDYVWVLKKNSDISFLAKLAGMDVKEV